MVVVVAIACVLDDEDDKVELDDDADVVVMGLPFDGELAGHGARLRAERT